MHILLYKYHRLFTKITLIAIIVTSLLFLRLKRSIYKCSYRMVKYHQMFKTYKYSNSTHFKEQIKVSNDFYFIL